MTAVPNRPTPAGRLIGRELARLADKAEAEDLKRFPNQRPRCQSCAFRLGTIPNGCEETVMDALKCVAERVPFMCHQVKDADGNCTELCAGWVAAQGATASRPRFETPWPFSKPPEGA
jgi:hypothetical protein